MAVISYEKTYRGCGLGNRGAVISYEKPIAVAAGGINHCGAVISDEKPIAVAAGGITVILPNSGTQSP